VLGGRRAERVSPNTNKKLVASDKQKTVAYGRLREAELEATIRKAQTKANPAESSDSRGVVFFTFDGSPRLKPGL
jgi:hypothetical protein